MQITLRQFEECGSSLQIPSQFPSPNRHIKVNICLSIRKVQQNILMAKYRRDGSKSLLGSKKITIRHSACNYRSFLLRLLALSTLICLSIWLLIQLNSLLFALFAPFESADSLNFTMVFSNVQREYSIKKPRDAPCEGRTIKLVVLVMSRREGGEQKRRGIRGSWAKKPPEGIIVRFVIGGPSSEDSNSTAVEIELETEQRAFGDFIRYSIEDGYANLHWKMSAAFQWQQTFCPNAEFVMKTDDDTVVDLERWSFWTERKFKKDLAKNSAAFFGHVLANTSPIRQKDNKWYVSVEDFPGNRYPDYMQGATYFGSDEAIRAVMAKAREVRGFNMDDIIFTGTAAERANVSRFDYKFRHFRGGDSLIPNEPCELGEPTVFALFKAYTKAVEYEKAYGDLHALKCKT